MVTDEVSFNDAAITKEVRPAHLFTVTPPLNHQESCWSQTVKADVYKLLHFKSSQVRDFNSDTVISLFLYCVEDFHYVWLK